MTCYIPSEYSPILGEIRAKRMNKRRTKVRNTSKEWGSWGMMNVSW